MGQQRGSNIYIELTVDLSIYERREILWTYPWTHYWNSGYVSGRSLASSHTYDGRLFVDRSR